MTGFPNFGVAVKLVLALLREEEVEVVESLPIVKG